MRLWRFILRAWYSDLDPEEADRVSEMPHPERKRYLRSKSGNPGHAPQRPLAPPPITADQRKAGEWQCTQTVRLAAGAFKALKSGSCETEGDLLELATLIKTTENSAIDLYRQLSAAPPTENHLELATQLLTSMQNICGELNIEIASLPPARIKRKRNHVHVGRFAPLLRKVTSSIQAESALEQVKLAWDAAAAAKDPAKLEDCINAASWLKTYLQAAEAREIYLRSDLERQEVTEHVLRDINRLVQEAHQMVATNELNRVTERSQASPQKD